MNAPEARAIADPYVLNERDERGVVTLTLNRPQQFNALSEGDAFARCSRNSTLLQETPARASSSSPARARPSARGTT